MIYVSKSDREIEKKKHGKECNSHQMKFINDGNIMDCHSVIKMLLLSFQVQHSAHNLFKQIKIIARM